MDKLAKLHRKFLSECIVRYLHSMSKAEIRRSLNPTTPKLYYKLAQKFTDDVFDELNRMFAPIGFDVSILTSESLANIVKQTIEQIATIFPRLRNPDVVNLNGVAERVQLVHQLYTEFKSKEVAERSLKRTRMEEDPAAIVHDEPALSVQVYTRPNKALASTRIAAHVIGEGDQLQKAPTSNELADMIRVQPKLKRTGLTAPRETRPKKTKQPEYLRDEEDSDSEEVASDTDTKEVELTYHSAKTQEWKTRSVLSQKIDQREAKAKAEEDKKAKAREAQQERRAEKKKEKMAREKSLSDMIKDKIKARAGSSQSQPISPGLLKKATKGALEETAPARKQRTKRRLDHHQPVDPQPVEMEETPRDKRGKEKIIEEEVQIELPPHVQAKVQETTFEMMASLGSRPFELVPEKQSTCLSSQKKDTVEEFSFFSCSDTLKAMEESLAKKLEDLKKLGKTDVMDPLAETTKDQEKEELKEKPKEKPPAEAPSAPLDPYKTIVYLVRPPGQDVNEEDSDAEKADKLKPDTERPIEEMSPASLHCIASVELFRGVQARRQMSTKCGRQRLWSGGSSSALDAKAEEDPPDGHSPFIYNVWVLHNLVHHSQIIKVTVTNINYRN
ncbi:hypothetical protein L7F22_027186 [Adiantum nelumboides]|nr:hypothetical protein [Adiantum nelumboides]